MHLAIDFAVTDSDHEPFVRQPRSIVTRIAATVVALALAIGTVVIAIAAAINLRKDRPEPRPDNVATVAIAGHTVAQLGTGATAIIMLHGKSTHRDAFYPYMPKLATAGFATYSIDYPSGQLPRAAVSAVKEYAFARGATSFVLMGSSLGAGYALQLSDLKPAATIAISAVSLNPTSGLVMSIASKNDGTTASIATDTVAVSASGSKALIVSGQTHGAAMIHNHPEILPAIIDFLTAFRA